MTLTTDTTTSGPRGWASKDDTPEMFPGVKHVWKRRRLAVGMKQSTVIRKITEMAACEGVAIAVPTSLAAMLSGWESGKRKVPACYEEMLYWIYGVRRPEYPHQRPVRYRNSAIYDRQLQAPASTVPLTQPGLR